MTLGLNETHTHLAIVTGKSSMVNAARAEYGTLGQVVQIDPSKLNSEYSESASLDPVEVSIQKLQACADIWSFIPYAFTSDVVFSLNGNESHRPDRDQTKSLQTVKESLLGRYKEGGEAHWKVGSALLVNGMILTYTQEFVATVPALGRDEIDLYYNVSSNAGLYLLELLETMNVPIKEAQTNTEIAYDRVKLAVIDKLIPAELMALAMAGDPELTQVFGKVWIENMASSLH